MIDIDTPVFPASDRAFSGMTLRDYFAAKLASTMIISSGTRTKEEIARYAYEVADAMLEARKL